MPRLRFGLVLGTPWIWAKVALANKLSGKRNERTKARR